MTKAKLSEVKLMGQLLLDAGKITNEQHDKINSLVNPGEKIYYGDVAIREHYITAIDRDQILCLQALNMAKAACDDIQIQVGGSKLKFEGFSQKIIWGNNGVNNKLSNPNQIEAASACANIAKIIVQFTNENISIAKDVQPGVTAAKQLTEFCIGKRNIDLSDKITDLFKDMKKSLKFTVEKNGNDQDKKLVEEYIENRFADVEKFLNIKMEQSKSPSIGF